MRTLLRLLNRWLLVWWFDPAKIPQRRGGPGTTGTLVHFGQAWWHLFPRLMMPYQACSDLREAISPSDQDRSPHQNRDEADAPDDQQDAVDQLHGPGLVVGVHRVRPATMRRTCSRV